MTSPITTAPKCTLPAALTVKADCRGAYALLDGSVTVHRYANLQAAKRGAALHAHPQACSTCLHGCDCEVTIPSHGCGHYGCWGQSAPTADRCAFAAIALDQHA